MLTKVVTDQMGYEVTVPQSPSKIISLVPSQTELLFDLGLSHEIKGVTKFCVHPKDQVSEIRKIGGTKQFRFGDIEDIAPDLIIGNKEENYQEGIQKLKEKYPVWMSDIISLSDAIQMIEKVSDLLNRKRRGKEIADNIRTNFASIQKKQSQRVLYFIWKKPYMVAGKETFIDSMLKQIGLKNAIETTRYPELSEEQIKAINPDLILLSSEPFPFKAGHFGEFSKLSPSAQIHIVDGEMFSWYGSRLLKAPEYFNALRF
ncbi:MAG: helical backbone metal receptor [Fulvivirga sp.]|nr:helical backbone metal receptor [Fulvivirga sp.]